MTSALSVSSAASKAKAGLGIVGGFVASVVMGLFVMVISYFGVLQVPWYPMIGSLFGGPAFGPEAALYGLTESFVLGIIFGLIFAFGFKTYSVMKGMGIAGVEFVLFAIVLASVSTPQLQGTLLSLPLPSILLLLVSLAIGLASWGATVGYVGKRYLK